MYRIFLLPEFKKRVKKLLSKKELEELEYFIENDLKNKGDKVGNQLSYPFLREKKISGKRVYYLVYKEFAYQLYNNLKNNKN